MLTSKKQSLRSPARPSIPQKTYYTIMMTKKRSKARVNINGNPNDAFDNNKGILVLSTFSILS